MGCRTRANEYYGLLAQRQTEENSWMEREIEGNVVRKPKTQSVPPVRIQKVQKRRTSVSANKRIRKQKAHLTLAGVAAAALVILLCCLMLSSMDVNGTLSDDVYDLEKQIEELTVFNDAREYEINASVDLNEVIRVATEELGMVRSSQAQVVTYSVKNSEYLQQVAAVPVE